jgi:hypothetical protein
VARASLPQWLAEVPRCFVGCDAGRNFPFLLALLADRPANLDPQRSHLVPLIDTGPYRHVVEKYHAGPEYAWHHASHDVRSYCLA